VAGSDTPICAGPHNASCHFVTGMTGRNHFAGPGSWNEDAAVIKNVKFTSRYVLQFKGEFLNIYNHANTMLNLGGTNDVSYSTDVLAYKTGNRKTELSVHFAF
jgi:hypothetical protein